jgi:hypothetical protein
MASNWLLNEAKKSVTIRAAPTQDPEHMQRSDTQSISIHAPREAVLDLVSDPTAFPRWASGFARAVRVDGPDWLVDTGTGEVRLRVRVSREYGTVDYLAAGALPEAELGSFGRVVPNGRGCDFIFTRFFPDAMGEGELAEERAVVAVELQTVRALCERRDLPAAA